MRGWVGVCPLYPLKYIIHVWLHSLSGIRLKGLSTVNLPIQEYHRKKITGKTQIESHYFFLPWGYIRCSLAMTRQRPFLFQICEVSPEGKVLRRKEDSRKKQLSLWFNVYNVGEKLFVTLAFCDVFISCSNNKRAEEPHVYQFNLSEGPITDEVISVQKKSCRNGATLGYYGLIIYAYVHNVCACVCVRPRLVCDMLIKVAPKWKLKLMLDN